MRRALRPLLVPVLVALAGSEVRAQGHVLVVDAAHGPGSDYADLSDAVNAAADGDVLLVRSGNYQDPILLNAKGLTVVADVGATVQVITVDVTNLPASRFAAFQNFAM